MNLVYTVLGAASIFPFITLLFFFYCLKKIEIFKKPFLLAIDFSTIFFILSVFVHFSVIFPGFSFYYLFYGMIFIGIITTYSHWKKFNDLFFKRLMKQYWRLMFLVFLILYVILTCYGLFVRVNEYIA